MKESIERYPSIRYENFQSDLAYYRVRVAIVDAILVRKCKRVSGVGGQYSVYVCKESLGGINYHSDSIIVSGNPKCLTLSGFTHELLHTLDSFYLGHDGHSAPYMFMQNTDEQKIKDGETIEFKVRDAGFKQFSGTCGVL